MTAAPATRRPVENHFDDSPAPAQSGMMDVATTRAAQEVQAMMVVAKKFPRDTNEAYARIMRACDRRTLAEQAQYAYPRGGSMVTGPSIRLAEEMARSWGNIDFGIVELEQNKGDSVMMAYAWDLETNTRQTKIFTVKHERHTRQGVTKLNDPRDIYEMTANQGSRRLRACILGIIPGDVTEAAVQRSDRTLAGNSDRPLADRVRDMVTAFDGIGVTKAMLETRLAHTLDATGEVEVINLRKIYQSLKDGMATREQFFPTPGGNKHQSEGAADLNDALEGDGDKANRAADQDTWQTTVTTHMHRNDCTVEDSTDQIVGFVQEAWKKDIKDLTDKEAADLLKRVEAGDLDL